MPQDQHDEDGIELLLRQHTEIRELFERVETARGADRRDAWRDLVRLLAVHETAEEEVVHPAARSGAEGERIVDARLTEERKAKEVLSTLDAMGPQAEGFDTLFLQLRDDVLAHAAHEDAGRVSPVAGRVHRGAVAWHGNRHPCR